MNKRLYIILWLILIVACTATAVEIVPVLEFPEAGMDDPARYKEYRTRFYRDSEKNALQIYMYEGRGRVVNLWADAANESLSFTVRDAKTGESKLNWCDAKADATTAQNARFVQYSLCSDSSTLDIGHFILDSMRKERDFQYFKQDTGPFTSPPPLDKELLEMISNLEKLPPEERSEHLKLLNAASTQELRQRLDPVITKNASGVSIEKKSFDGKNHLWLELSFEKAEVTIGKNQVSIRAGAPVRIGVKVGTDAKALNPLDRKDIFNEAFFQYYADMEKRSATSEQAKIDFRWLEREVRGMELVCYQDKLMAGLPNFATYFGRDTMMSALMFEPIWSHSMMEHSITSVLRKLNPRGEASHEEALGGQAIKENADEYNKLLQQYFTKKDSSLLGQAREIIQDLQRVRENYNMIDDDFQLPILIGRFLANPEIPPEKKRAFLEKWIGPVLRNFTYISGASRAYVEKQQPIELVSFPKGKDQPWMSASWRDSGPGYAGGRFAMDVNAIWVPTALASMASGLQFIASSGYDTNKFEPMIQDMDPKAKQILLQYVKDASALNKAVQTWQGAMKHFWVKLNEQEIRSSIESKLKTLPDQEREFWQAIMKQQSIPPRLEFLALSLDESGVPIRVLNTDPATWLYLGDHSKLIMKDHAQPGSVYKILDSILTLYPAGLFVENLGPLCANDAYAPAAVQKRFEKDLYHSPRVVWGREVNLLTLGLLKQIVQGEGSQVPGMESYISRLRDALKRIRAAVEGSGLKHNELWSYQFVNGKLVPVRYGSSSDIQLWNLTDLSIQFQMNKLK